MNSIIILCVTILFSVSAFAVPIGDGKNGEESVDGRVCKPGATYNDGCNTVMCLPNHVVVSSQKACINFDANHQPVPIPVLKAPEDFWQKAETKKSERICKPGASYFDGCNTVNCLPDNVIIRTEMACFQTDANGEQIPVPEKEAPEDFWQKTETKKPARLCKPGASYFDGCNTVSCAPNNVQYQTLIDCDTIDSNGTWHMEPVLEAPEDFWLQE